MGACAHPHITRESGVSVVRHRLIQACCAVIVLVTLSSAWVAADTTTGTTSVTLQASNTATGCAIWFEPAEPIRFGRLVPPFDGPSVQTFSLRVVNGQAIVPAHCAVTVGGSSFLLNGIEQRSIHHIKLEQAAGATASVKLVPRVSEMALGELQAVLVHSPSASGWAVVLVTLDPAGLPRLPADAVVIGTITLTLSDIAP
jgi:hypothetical protein